MRFWQFSKPKGPGYSLSKDFYFSVLAAKATLPSILEIVNPDGEGGGVVGFGAPLSSGKTKEDLARPMTRGGYVIATKDRKTVLRGLVISKEEAGFDPDAFLRSSQAAAIPDEMAARIRSTWTLIQLNFESHDPDVYPSLDFLQDIAMRLGTLTDGVIADPIGRRYQMPYQLKLSPRANPKIDAREHVVVTLRAGTGGLHGFTLGMQKFSLPEFELYGIPDALHSQAQLFLIGLAQTVLEGKVVAAGETVGIKSAGFEVREGGLDRQIWDGIPALELIPVRGRTVEQALTENG